MEFIRAEELKEYAKTETQLKCERELSDLMEEIKRQAIKEESHVHWCIDTNNISFDECEEFMTDLGYKCEYGDVDYVSRFDNELQIMIYW